MNRETPKPYRVRRLPNVLLVNYTPSEKRNLAQFLSQKGLPCLPLIPTLDDKRLFKPFIREAGHGTVVDVVLIDLSRSSNGDRGEIGTRVKKVHLFLRRIREMNSTACVILTGSPIALDKVSKLLRYGVYDYLCLPLSLKHLEKTIEQGLKNKEQAEEILSSMARANQKLAAEKEHLKKRTESLNVIYEINQTVAGCLNIDDLICSFGEGLKRLVPYDALSIFLKGNEEVDRVWMWATSEKKSEKKKGASRTAFLKKLQAKTVAWGNAYLRSDTISSEAMVHQKGAELIIPLSVAGEKVGLLRMKKNLVNKKNLPFDQDQADILLKVVIPFCLTLHNAYMYQRVNAMALTDELTRVLNRRAFMHLLEREYKRFVRLHTPMTLLIIDLDCFKGVNDRYGHLVGDVVLKEMAALLKNSMREIDILARYGGEEFVAILPETKPAEGLIVAERIRHLSASHLFNEEHDPIQVTVSIGIVTLPSSTVESAEAFLHLADLALYRAKKKGRNRIECGFSHVDHDKTGKDE